MSWFFLLTILILLAFAAPAARAQPLQKSAVTVDAGNTKLTGATFGYRLTYSCNNTLTDCANARVVDLLPPEVQEVSTVPASPGGDVAAINVTPNFGGTGRTQVEFVMVNPLTAGNSGDLIINVRFPNGSTADGTVATNTADGINLETAPGTFTTPPVDVTAVAASNVTLTKTLLTSPALLDQPVNYRLRLQVPSSDGSLNVTGISVADTLPPGSVFNGASPAADCEPGCVGTVAPALAWAGPFSVNAGSQQDITVTVTFPSATFTDGESVTNTFTADGTPLGEAPENFGVGTRTHDVEVFTPAPSASLGKVLNGPNPPTTNQDFNYRIDPRNNGNVDLENFVVIDALPIAFQVTSVTTGAFNNPSAMVAVAYETNLSAGFVALGASPGGTNATFPIPGLAPGEYVTRLRWDFGTAPAGMQRTNNNNRPRIDGRVIDPDHAGNPVNFGDTITNCVDLTAVFDPGGVSTPVAQNTCRDFTLSGPFMQFSPSKDNQSGGGPFNVGQTIQWRLRVRSNANSSDPIPLEDLVVVDLLPVDLLYTAASFVYDANGTGLPAPTLEELPNYNNTGRTLLRWSWPAASGDLQPGQEPRLTFQTTVRFGAGFGSLTNTFGMTHNDPGLGQRCGSSSTDVNDLDGDSNTADTLCVASRSATIAPIAQLASSKTVLGLCDGGFGTSSTGTLRGGAIDYRLRVQNVGTVPMEGFVLVDILPFLGDTGVLDLTPRGSQWTPGLTAPIVPPAGTTIFYSTSGNPCRSEVGGPTSGCDAPNWTTVAPGPISSVRSFKIEFGDRVVDPGDILEFTFRLTALGDTPVGQTAFNSFAYLGQRSDGLGSLSAEPNKVGIALGGCPAAELGDFVWVDTDGDGIQNDGPTGVNDVFVRLFNPGADGIPRTFDDVPLSSTVTSDDPGGDPGWYFFPGLAPGDYYVQFEPPPTFFVTVANAGGDDALDSDADPATACSPVVNLAAAESDPTIDLGLLPPEPAALGDYVWFDRDADGVQNESPFFGVDGVTVRLYVDDGDGTPEPGGDDGAPVAFAATAKDIYDRPGYYLFDGLTPGVPYFVEFVLPASATGFTTTDSGGDDTVDSDAAVPTGVTPVVVLGSGEVRLDLDAGLIAPLGDLVLGDQVWCDDDDDGIFEPQDGELGVDGVTLSLYLDVNGDGEPTTDEYLGATVTATAGDFAGRYLFDLLDDGDYIVVVDLENFSGGGALAGKVTSSGNDPAPDPDDDVNGDDNGTDVGALVASRAVTLVNNGEPITEDGDNDTNLTVDFGFTFAPAVAPPVFDYGDAPDIAVGNATGDYRTTALDNGPLHLLGVAGSPYLGACVDADNGVQQNLGADADDLAAFGLTTGTCAVQGDDEDGVVFTNPVVIGSMVTIAVTASDGTNDCALDAWIDWDRDGLFEAAEQIATSLNIPAGNTTNLTPLVPTTARPGLSYGRFRCSTAGGLGPEGLAADGEVEDHLFAIQGTDFGDAPDSYTTLGASVGPSHGVDPRNGLRLGACVDTETDGQPNVGADGDDLGIGSSRVGLCLDDEDGVLFLTPVVACQTAQLAVTASAAARLDAFLDFNGDGSFGAGEKIFDNLAVVAGVNPLMVAVPCNAATGVTYARFRLSTAGGLGAGGAAADGEVEDYVLNLLGNDWGDDPAPFPTLLANNGARHGVDLAGSLFLGSCVDTEGDGQPSGTAVGDDAGAGSTTAGACVGGDDEDGVTFSNPLVACQTTTLSITAATTGVLDAWIDFAGDAAWTQGGDRIVNGLVLTAGANTPSVTVPCSTPPGDRFTRFRFSSAGVATFDGPALDGEVEDYVVPILGVDFGDAPDSYGTTFGTGGPTHGVDPTTSLFLGGCVDTESSAATPLDASGDDVTAGLATVAGTCTGNDDEDGVTFNTLIVACENADLTITAGTAGVLDGWIDFGGDGTFDAGDRIFNGEAVAAGANARTIAVPCAAVPGATYARLRLSPTGVAGPTGPTAAGEVEDYAVRIDAMDFGDAPDSYGTTLAAGGPRHDIVPATNLFLGSCVDTEGDARAPLTAIGDDNNASLATVVGTCTGNDDEDGVTFGAPLVACTIVPVTVTANAGGFLDAWIDFDLDGAFDPTDQVFFSDALVAGPNNLSVTVPCNAAEGTTYTRFRFSSTGGLNPGGPATDGEVEDHAAEARRVDYGDAPVSYGTIFGDDGARHGIVDGFRLGAVLDEEVDGQPTPGADGDDTNVGGGGGGGGGDDEDGVTFPGGMAMAAACTTTSVTVNLVNTAALPAALLDAWIDFDGDGAFDEPRDRIATTQALADGNNTVNYTVPCDAQSAAAYARFRLSSAGVATALGSAVDGEVEDYAFTSKGLDFGDAADPTYPTLLVNDGARHSVLPVANPTLGTLVDTEADGQPTALHNGDDGTTSDDEDGVTFPAVLIPGATGLVRVTTGGTGGLVSGWIDFNQDGDWNDPGEQVLTDQAMAASGDTTFSFPVPIFSPDGSSCARFRISSQSGLGVTGPAPDGEVEDHLAPMGVEDPRLGISKQLVDLTEETNTVFLLTFEVGVFNFGNVPLSDLGATVDLAAAFALAAGYQVISVNANGGLTPNAAFDGAGNTQLLAPGNTLAVGGMGVITLVIRVDSGGERGPYTCSATGTGTSPEDTPVTDMSQDGGDPDPNSNGDPGDDDEPTVVVLPVSVLEIPTLDTVGLLLLMLFLGGFAIRRIAR